MNTDGTLRKVTVYTDKHKKEVLGTGKFHAWGNSPLPSNRGFVTMTEAIIEFDDGTVKLINPERIVFVNEKGKKYHSKERSKSRDCREIRQPVRSLGWQENE